jgi:hypothetical protein
MVEGRDTLVRPLAVHAHGKRTVVRGHVLEQGDPAGGRCPGEMPEDLGQRRLPLPALQEPLRREARGLEHRVAPRERLLRELGGRDVDEDTLPVFRRPVGVAQEDGLVSHPDLQ